MIYSHDGDLGDTLAAMAVMRELDGGDLVLYPTDTRERYNPKRVGLIAPLLERQHYVKSVRYADRAAPDGIDLGGWRFNYMSGLNLSDMYFSWIHKPHIDRDQPWLFCHEPNHVADVVFCRSPRYHGNFPWRRAVKKYAGHSVFVGLPEEHKAFVREFGDIPYHPTKDLWEVAQVIQAAKLVLVNQTCNFWITEGLKRPVCLEAANGDSGLRNCHWDRTGSIYGMSQLMELPDLDILDERLAYVCAERDLDRSVLGDKRLQLARLALSVASLPGEAAEFGVYRGGGAAIIAAALPSKTLHLFDTFEGIPEDDDVEGGHKKGDFGTSFDDVQRFLAGYNVKYHVGFFPQTAEGMPNATFSFVHLDADTYQSTKAGIEYFWPRMVPGGVMVFDDYGWGSCPGVLKAIEEAGVKVTVGVNQAWATKS